MIKYDELRQIDSCINRAHDDEPVFVLLGRDPAAPAVIQEWVWERIRLGKNQLHDDQIREAVGAVIELAQYGAKREARKELDQPE